MYMIIFTSPEIMKAFHFDDLYMKGVDEIQVSPEQIIDSSLTVERDDSFRRSVLSNSSWSHHI